MSVEHVLKCWPNYYDAIASGQKPFEVRKDDRGFQKGDTVALKRYDPKISSDWDFENLPGAFPTIRKRISWVLTGGQFGIESGYVVLGLTDIQPSDGGGK